ncbi:MAG: hypothetical protein MUF51_06515 [Vicinamibacteria bacterium]|jgi:hypothetical protein|nr:hypothetical protein [Vicinamibacteria bacterium]
MTPLIRQSSILALALASLFGGAAAFHLSQTPSERLFLYWRAYDDFALGAGLAAQGRFPVAPYRVRDQIRRDKDPRFRVFKDNLLSRLAEGKIRPIHFWKTIPAQEISPDQGWLIAKRFDDTGRALLLGACFKGLRGAAPYLLFWLAIFAALPVLAWAAYELSCCGHGLAAALFILMLSVSAFVHDLLTLGYSTAGFHLLGILLVIPLAAYAALAAPTPRGLLARTGAAGCVLGLFILCRGTGLMLLAGYALALILGIARLPRDDDGQHARIRARRRLLLAVVGLTLLLAPYAAFRYGTQRLVNATRHAYNRQEAPQYHDPALLIWKGLGDFDRSKGYEFKDKAGEQAIQRSSSIAQAARAEEIHLRDVILRDIYEDPLWFARILAARTLTTITLYKLWPWAPRDGHSIHPAASANEGVIDNYYALSSQADWLTFGAWTGELPITLLLAPSLLWALLGLAPWIDKRTAPFAARARRAGPLLACATLAILPSPVLITTATALESECFVLAHLLAAAFLIESLVLYRRALPANH